jgi:hypothetical protein
MPLTSTWEMGERVEIDTTLTIPDDLPPGDYRLLAAIYTPLGNYPRVPVTLQDGATATEGLSDPIRIGGGQ